MERKYNWDTKQSGHWHYDALAWLDYVEWLYDEEVGDETRDRSSASLDDSN